METDGYVRSFGITAGETRHLNGFESHPPHTGFSQQNRFYP